MQRLRLAILAASLSLLPSIRAAEGLIITTQEENLRSGNKTTATVYLEPHRLAVRGANGPRSMTLAHLAEDQVLRLIDHQRETVIDSQQFEIISAQAQRPDFVEDLRKIVMDRLETMDEQQRAASEHHLWGRYCEVRLAARGSQRERSKLVYSRAAGSAMISGHECDWYVGRRGGEMVSSVCSAPVNILDTTPAEFEMLRQSGDLFGSRWPSVASILHSRDRPEANSDRYPGVAIEETVYCNGQALLRNTLLESRRAVIDAEAYAAPSGYADLTCRDEGLCN